MSLPGEKVRALAFALAEAFPDPWCMRRFVRTRLDDLVSEFEFEWQRSTATIAFQLVRWSESTGNVEPLIRAAHNENPRNPGILAIHKQLPGWLEPTRATIEPVESSQERFPTVVRLANLREELDVSQGAEAILKEAISKRNDGPADAEGALIHALASIHELRGDLRAAERAYNRAWELGYIPTAHALLTLLEKQPGREQEYAALRDDISFADQAASYEASFDPDVAADIEFLSRLSEEDFLTYRDYFERGF